MFLALSNYLSELNVALVITNNEEKLWILHLRWRKKMILLKSSGSSSLKELKVFDRCISFVLGFHEDIYCHGWDSALWLNEAKQVRWVKNSGCNRLLLSVWSHYEHRRAHPNFPEWRHQWQQSLLLNSWKPQGFPRQGVASPLSTSKHINNPAGWLTGSLEKAWKCRRKTCGDEAISVHS